MIRIKKEDVLVAINYVIAYLVIILFYLALITVAAVLAFGPLLLKMLLHNGMFLFFYFVTIPALVKFVRYWFADVWTY